MQRIDIAHTSGELQSALQLQTPHSGSETPLLVFSHATGFHAATYRPLLDQLAHHMDIIAPDSRGHGESALSARPDDLKAWTRYYRDLEQVIHAQNRPVILAGHSIGGMCSLAVAARNPQQVRGVLAMDPVLLEPKQGLSMRVLQWLGRSDRFSLAAGAKRRRADFASAEQAFENYRTKRSFSTWPDEWLRAYTDHAFRPEGDGVRLRCDPAWESRTFAMVEHWPWRFVKHIKSPVLILTAEHGSTCSESSRKRLKAMRPDWDIRVMPGTSHFLPMEKTADIARLASDFVKKCNSG